MTASSSTLLTRQHRWLVWLIVSIALLVQWAGVGLWIERPNLRDDLAGGILIGGSVLISVAIVLLGVGLYIVLGHVRSTQHELALLGTTDTSTGVLNRRGFMSAAAQEFTRTTRYDRPLSVLQIDIDRFEALDEKYGTGAGDAMLRALTLSWQSVLRTTDTVGRVGGEEFAVLLPETSESQAIELAERLRQACERIRAEGVPSGASVTISIGVGCVRTGDSSIDHAIARADEALYRAKAAGSNQVRGPERAPAP